MRVAVRARNGWQTGAAAIAALCALVAGDAGAAPVARFVATPVQGEVCVAPCAVHFDAIGDGVGSLSHDPSYARPFHALHFAWQFDDPSDGIWPISGKTQRTAFGAIAGHLYETPGTYAVALKVTNPAGESAAISGLNRVRVADPNQVFAATDTWCFANAGTPGGAGFEACPVQLASQHVVIGYQPRGFEEALEICDATTRKTRCLFRAGHLFGVRDPVRLSDADGPGLVSRFGTGANPIVFGGDGFLILRNGWTVAHFEVWANGSGIGPLFLLSSYNSRVTVFDVTAPLVRNTCFESSIADTPTHSDLVAIVDLDCRVQSSLTDASAVYLRAERVLFLGNRIDNSYEGQFNFRSVHLPRSVIQHSRFERPHTDGVDRRNNLQIRAWSGASSTGQPIGPPPSPTEFVVVSDNVLSQDDAETSIRTCQSNDCQNTALATDVQDLLFERNFFRWSTGSGEALPQMTRAFWLQGGDITVRHNVFDLQGMRTAPSPSRNRFAWHDPNLAGGPGLNDDRVQILHNTIYYDDASPNGFELCGGAAAGTGHLCRNNLVFAPSETGLLVEADSPARWAPIGNLFATALPFGAAVPGQGATTAAHFALGPSSPALGFGWDPRPSDVALWGDFDALCRPERSVPPATGGAWDAGAFERSAGLHCLVTPEPGTALLLGTGLVVLARRRRTQGRSVRRVT